MGEVQSAQPFRDAQVETMKLSDLRRLYRKGRRKPKPKNRGIVLNPTAVEAVLMRAMAGAVLPGQSESDPFGLADHLWTRHTEYRIEDLVGPRTPFDKALANRVMDAECILIPTVAVAGIIDAAWRHYEAAHTTVTHDSGPGAVVISTAESDKFAAQIAAMALRASLLQFGLDKALTEIVVSDAKVVAASEITFDAEVLKLNPLRDLDYAAEWAKTRDRKFDMLVGRAE